MILCYSEFKTATEASTSTTATTTATASRYSGLDQMQQCSMAISVEYTIQQSKLAIETNYQIWKRPAGVTP